MYKGDPSGWGTLGAEFGCEGDTQLIPASAPLRLHALMKL